MAVCPFCGCKTDELDFITCTVENDEVKICSFCEKQVKKLVADEAPAAAQLRWLESIVSKDVSRDATLYGVVRKLQVKYLPETLSASSSQPSAESVASQPATVKTSAAKTASASEWSSAGTGVSQAQYNELLERIETVENQFKKYKKAQLIKTAVELMAPFILLIIGLIIFFASGLFEDLSGIFNASGLFDM